MSARRYPATGPVLAWLIRTWNGRDARRRARIATADDQDARLDANCRSRAAHPSNHRRARLPEGFVPHVHVVVTTRTADPAVFFEAAAYAKAGSPFDPDADELEVTDTGCIVHTHPLGGAA